MNFLSGIEGLKIIVSPLAYRTERKQIRFPRTKKRCIQKKWRKQDRNFLITHIPQAYKIAETLICHPSIYNQLKEICRQKTYYGDI
jgi:hypothetical protein